MPRPPETLNIRPLPKNILWIGFWALVFFVIINICISQRYDGKYFDKIGFDRLTLEPSDNAVLGILDSMKREEDKKHLVVLGDSVLWGVGVNEVEETVAGILREEFKEDGIRVVNLAQPGSSFIDMAALALNSYDEDNIYLYFLNPIRFDDNIALRDFGEAVRFENIVLDTFNEDRRKLEILFGQLPDEKSRAEKVLKEILFRLIPIYRNRDLITQSIIRMHPAITVNTLVNRVRDMRFGEIFENIPMDLENDNKEIPERKDPESIENNPTLSHLEFVLPQLRDKPNIFFVIQDDNWFRRTWVQNQNIRRLEGLIDSDRMLNLYKTVDSSLYYDRTHLNEGGQREVAQAVIDFLSKFNVP
ncbi:hypothetical protein KJ652_05160 [Patescibacteria group bacterium]|nr:hypothetical protein [Patescibacteria group bacterium]MBU1123952.1 hypothetical protein [Patescibacteria group bacterium]MBU1910837.1 hypothetical protein [Patescibacteria group bacterium]